MDEYVNILVVEPGKKPYPAVVANTLEAAEYMTGGSIQIGCFLPQRVLVVSRENTEGLAPNRCIPQTGKCISGTFLLYGIPEDGCHFASLTPEKGEALQKIFASPGEFMMIGKEVYRDPDEAAEAVYTLWDHMENGETVKLTKYGSIRRDERMIEQ